MQASPNQSNWNEYEIGSSMKKPWNHLINEEFNHSYDPIGPQRENKITGEQFSLFSSDRSEIRA